MPDRNLRDDIQALLSPLIGESLAQASIKVQCERNGLDPEHLKAADLPVLARSLGQGLVCFVGRVRSEQMVAAIEALGRR